MFGRSGVHIYYLCVYGLEHCFGSKRLKPAYGWSREMSPLVVCLLHFLVGKGALNAKGRGTGNGGIFHSQDEWTEKWRG